MFSKEELNSSLNTSDLPKEGELYKKVSLFGRSFELRYGYYDDIDRQGPPDVIYPDLKLSPIFTDDGVPIVTMMQDACPRFMGKGSVPEDSTCAECKYFRRCVEWFGLCVQENNKKQV